MKDKRQKRVFNTSIWPQTKGKLDQWKVIRRSQVEKQSTSNNNSDKPIQQQYHQQDTNLREGINYLTYDNFSLLTLDCFREENVRVGL